MTVLQDIEEPGCGCDAVEAPAKPISIDAALDLVASHAAPVEATERVALATANGRVLAAPVAARAMMPPFDNSAMDGYVLNTRDLSGPGPWRLPVSDRVAAGSSAKTGLGRASAARIFTGAPIPDCADAVVMQERVIRRSDAIVLQDRPDPGQHIRRAGEELALGAPVLPAGRRLCPRAIAACAAAGHGTVTVRRRIKIVLVVTGDELCPAGGDLGTAAIWDVNTPMLLAALDRASVDLIEIRSCADDRAAVRSRIAELSAAADLIVTSGAVSVGEEDHVKPALQELGAEIYFSGVAMKPGKPVSFGRVGRAFWLGLPGNPLSAFVTWHLFGTALLRGLSGQDEGGPQRRQVITGHAIRHRPGRSELRHARLTGRDEQGRDIAACDAATHSARIVGLSCADGLLVIPAEADHLPEGALVEFLPFHDL